MQPITLGSFAVARDGALQPRRAGSHPAIRFAWRGRACEAALTGDAVQLAAIAARVPSTAEPGVDRPGAFAELAALPRSLPSGWRLSLLPDHRIRLEACAPLEAPPTATALITLMVRFALALDPYLDRLDSACAGPCTAPWGATPWAASSGTAKTWPG
jgi:hypothetical protein